MGMNNALAEGSASEGRAVRLLHTMEQKFIIALEQRQRRSSMEA
jgi:hypothetical protein